jgi:putative tryptophan/tyrosine transport system substrate-binding protein
MRRREFIAGLGTALAWPTAAQAQQRLVPVIGLLSSRASGDAPYLMEAVRVGLREAGFVAGQNVAIEYRFADNQNDRLQTHAVDLVRHRVALIVALGGNDVAAAAKAATATIPIVSNFGSDPVLQGLVASFNRPGGNITGISRLSSELLPKRLELLHEVAPKATVIAFLVNPDSGYVESDTRDVQAAARAHGLQVQVVKASTEWEIESVFAALVELHAGTLLIENDPFFTGQSEQLGKLTLHYEMPAMHSVREFVVAGGLMSYAPSIADVYRQVGVYAGRVLKGDKPADLPVQQAVKVELIINLKTANALGLTIPETLLATADEVIQ